jgi:hypothetical protein
VKSLHQRRAKEQRRCGDRDTPGGMVDRSDSNFSPKLGVATYVHSPDTTLPRDLGRPPVPGDLLFTFIQNTSFPLPQSSSANPVLNARAPICFY